MRRESRNVHGIRRDSLLSSRRIGGSTRLSDAHPYNFFAFVFSPRNNSPSCLTYFSFWDITFLSRTRFHPRIYFVSLFSQGWNEIFLYRYLLFSLSSCLRWFDWLVLANVFVLRDFKGKSKQKCFYYFFTHYNIYE